MLNLFNRSPEDLAERQRKRQQRQWRAAVTRRQTACARECAQRRLEEVQEKEPLWWAVQRGLQWFTLGF